MLYSHGILSWCFSILYLMSRRGVKQGAGGLLKSSSGGKCIFSLWSLIDRSVAFR